MANANDTSIVFVKPELPLVLWYSVTSVNICVGRGVDEVGELSTYYCPDCKLVVE